VSERARARFILCSAIILCVSTGSQRILLLPAAKVPGGLDSLDGSGARHGAPSRSFVSYLTSPVVKERVRRNFVTAYWFYTVHISEEE
jgi:hypothetical protein